jgi:uncharacterized phage protein gp47/JayE
VDLPVQAGIVGSGGNVLAGSISLLSTPIPGVDSVNNAQPTGGGAAPESDAAFRQRFLLYINSRSLATTEAVSWATASVQPGLRYAVLANQTISGVTQLGSFCVVVDDGTGVTTSALLQAVQAAVDTVRPIGVNFAVFPPTVISVSIAMTLEVTDSGAAAVISSTVQASIAAWVAGLPVGGILSLSKLEAIAHAQDSRVVSVTSASINGATQDLAAGPNSIFVASSVVVS